MSYYRRWLPHWHPPGQDIFLTWRLHGSLPNQTSKPKENSSPGEQFVHYDRFLDQASFGPLWLRNPQIAERVLFAITEAQRQKMLQVRAYVLMVNHVHVLLTPLLPLEQITKRIKGVSARQANRILLRTGVPFWQDESFDRWVRNPAESLKIRTYIERNPVTAGLVMRPEDWPWSSASHPIKQIPEQTSNPKYP